MKTTTTYTIGGHTYTAAQLAAADWERDVCNRDTYIDIADNGNMRGVMGADEYPYISHWARMPDGALIEIAVVPTDATYCYVNHNDAAVIRTETDADGDEETDEDALSELCDMLVIGEHEDINPDYETAAAEWVRDNPGVRYYLDPKRGFANNWTLYCVAPGAALPEDVDEDDCEELDAEDAEYYLAQGIMSANDYEAEHGAQCYCGARYIG